MILLCILLSACSFDKQSTSDDVLIPKDNITTPSTPIPDVEKSFLQSSDFISEGTEQIVMPIFDYHKPSDDFINEVNQIDGNSLPELRYGTAWSIGLLQIGDYIVYSSYSWQGTSIRYCKMDGSDSGVIGKFDENDRPYDILKMYDKYTLLLAYSDDIRNNTPPRSYIFNMITGEFNQTQPAAPDDYMRKNMGVRYKEIPDAHKDYIEQKGYPTDFVIGAKDNLLIYGIKPNRLVFEDISNGNIIKEIKVEYIEGVALRFIVFYDSGICIHQEDDIGYSLIGYIANDSNKMIELTTNENAFYGYYIFGDWLYLIGYTSDGLHGGPDEVWDSAKLARVELTGGEIEWLN